MVTLEEMKNDLRVDYGDDDTLIEGMISAAVKQWEFTPSQGNGTIAAVALTSSFGG